MNANVFRRIGYIYAVFCFFCSVLGAVYFFKKILEPKTFCVPYFCESGFEHLLMSAISMVMCLLSATFSIFVKLGVEEGEAGYIHISRTFMLVRSLVLTVRWTYESVSVTFAEIRQDASPVVVEQFRCVATTLLVVITAFTGLELWILDGVQRYTQQRLQEETASHGS